EVIRIRTILKERELVNLGLDAAHHRLDIRFAPRIREPHFPGTAREDEAGYMRAAPARSPAGVGTPSGGTAADPRRTGRLAGRAPDLIVWMKSRAAEDVLLMSRKHPQRTPPPRRWWQPLNRHCAQTPGAGWAAEHTVDRVRRLRRRCGHSALTLAVLFEPRISVVHQPHWFLNRKFRTAGGASSWGTPGPAKANPAHPRQR